MAQKPAAETAEPDPAPTHVFQRPTIAAIEREILILLQIGARDRAAARLDATLAKHPDVEGLHFLKGLHLAVSGERDAAVDSLTTAWRMGDRQLRPLQSQEQFAWIFEDPAIITLLAEEDLPFTPPDPVGATQGTALVEADGTAWNPAIQRLVSPFALPGRLDTKPVMTGPSAIARRLRQLVISGKAAGLAGVFYDNRDRGHGPMRTAKFPQLTSIAYDAEAQARGLDYGLNTQITFEGITFGNSSTAITGQQWRSQGRFALTQPLGPMLAAQSYRLNQIYLFPEHRDHDQGGRTGRGDLYPANTPFMLFSQGSSGSERRMLDAIAIILAALPRDTRALLEEEGLIAPAVQQIFRRGQVGIGSDADYLSPRAHPTVFDSKNASLERMIDLAQAMRADQIPPAVVLDVVAESRNPAPFADGTNEGLFTTPFAIARIHRSLERTRQMTVSAGRTEDPNGLPLTFEWVVLRGLPDRVRITPRGTQNETAQIEIDWHPRFEAASPPGMPTQRVDIGVFAHNGHQWSAPSFISVSFPPRQQRTYNGEGRLVEIDYRDPALRELYADPLLFVERDWTDRFIYTDDGRSAGWVRGRGGQETGFTRHGLKIIERDAQGRPAIAEFVTYPIDRSKAARPRVVETPTGQQARYEYKSEEDLLGEPVLIRRTE
ncbi:MAG: bacterial transcriptional activator domain-containing protein [Pseudomonadota bacterium]